MDNRTRTLRVLEGRSVDRLPAVHFGYWQELLQEWQQQGHISAEVVAGWSDHTAQDRTLDRLLGWDYNWSSVYRGYMDLLPAFEHRVLERLPDGFVRYQNAEGLILRAREGATGIPAEDDYLLKDREAWERLYLPKLQYSPARVRPEALRRFCDTPREYPVGLYVGSVLGTVRNMLSVVGLSYMMADDPELLQEIVDTHADTQYRTVEAILATGARFDFGHFWEDICFKNGPLVSPATFDGLCAKHYRRMTELLHRHGIRIVSLDCDGVVGQLIPTWLQNGVNTLFPIEVGVWGDQFEAARRRHGPTLLGVGGMDKTVLRRDREAVDREIERLRPLVALGGFLPCPDHRLMPGTKWELVQYYIEKIKSMKI
ncbi:MAG: uroporphyrinogen decarboxylase family protein [Eubacteriales bacterium]